MKKSLIALSIATATLIGCGGGGSTPDPIVDPVAPITPKGGISGKAIDGYIVGATIFIDSNYNGVLDANETFTTTIEGGDYTLADDPCQNYSPLVVDVPVGAVDETEGEVLEAYQMITPPAVATPTIGDRRMVTPLTSVIWETIQSEVGNLSCEALMDNTSTIDNVVSSVDNIASSMARHHNRTVEELFGDYVAAGDVKLYDASTKIVDALKLTYSSTKALKALYPDAEHVMSAYNQGTVQNDGNLNDTWYHDTYIALPGRTIRSREVLDSETLKFNYLMEKSDKSNTEVNGFTYKRTFEFSNDYNTPTGFCRVFEDLQANGKDNAVYTITNSVKAEMADYGSCLLMDFTENMESRTIKTSEQSVSNSWYYLPDSMDNVIGLDDWIDLADKLADFSPADLEQAISGYSLEFTNTDMHGADSVLHIRRLNGVTTMWTSFGGWSEKTELDNGTYTLQCGATEDSMVAMPAGTISCPRI